jgi:hypothetical protein
MPQNWDLPQHRIVKNREKEGHIRKVTRNLALEVRNHWAQNVLCLPSVHLCLSYTPDPWSELIQGCPAVQTGTVRVGMAVKRGASLPSLVPLLLTHIAPNGLIDLLLP